jgi:hypothetical protein
MNASRLRPAWPFLLLAILVAAVYWPGRGGGFEFDDYPNIVDNTALHVTNWDRHAWLAAVFSSDSGIGHRPLPMATFALNHVFTGLDPMPMKLTNIAIHALNACLVLCLLRVLLALAAPAIDARRREWSARFAAAAWALHPINLMGVLFVVQRMESLCHAFVFAGLWLYLLGRQRQLAGDPGGWPRILAGIVGGTGLGVLCKESAVLLPLYAACMELCLLGFRKHCHPDPGLDPGEGPAVASRAPVGKQVLRLRLRMTDGWLLGFFGIVLVLPALLGSAWLWSKALAPTAFASRDFTLGERLLTEGRVVLDYLRWTLFPSLRAFGLYHDDIAISRGWLQPASTAFALAALALFAVVGFLARKRRPLVALGIAWFLGAQLLTATIVPLELVFEHRNYFASLGICLAVADLLLLAPRNGGMRRIGALLAVLWLLFLGMTTLLRAREWSDPLRFATSEAAKHPQSPRATYDRARLMALATGYKAGSPLLPQAFAALEQARAVPGSGILPHSALLILAARTGSPIDDAWWREMLDRLRRDPVGVQELGAIGAVTQCARDRDCDFPPEAILAMFQAALDNGGRRKAEIMNIEADYVFNALHQPDTALYLRRRAIELAPREPQYRINRAKVLIALGRFPEARADIAALRAIGPPGANEADAQALERRLARARQRASTGQGD